MARGPAPGRPCQRSRPRAPARRRRTAAPQPWLRRRPAPRASHASPHRAASPAAPSPTRPPPRAPRARSARATSPAASPGSLQRSGVHRNGNGNTGCFTYALALAAGMAVRVARGTSRCMRPGGCHSTAPQMQAVHRSAGRRTGPRGRPAPGGQLFQCPDRLFKGQVERLRVRGNCPRSDTSALTCCPWRPRSRHRALKRSFAATRRLPGSRY